MDEEKIDYIITKKVDGEHVATALLPPKFHEMTVLVPVNGVKGAVVRKPLFKFLDRVLRDYD